MNGRTYRLTPLKDKTWELHRLTSLDDERGSLIGRYKHRRDANAVLAKMAYWSSSSRNHPPWPLAAARFNASRT